MTDRLMTEGMAETVLRTAIIGIGGTEILDLWGFLLERCFGVPATDLAMVGRWVGHMPAGCFIHHHIGAAAPVSGEHAIGWIVHYVIGTAYGFFLIAVRGLEWMRKPTILPPLTLALVLVAAPYFLVMPGMGYGIAGAKTPRPNITRLKSLMGHSVFGLGMYVTGLGAEAAFGHALAWH